MQTYKPLTFPVSVGDGVNRVVAVVDSDQLAAIRRRRGVDVVLQDAGTVAAVAEGKPALRP